jgi:outer membrane beta-barrel protein
MTSQPTLPRGPIAHATVAGLRTCLAAILFATPAAAIAGESDLPDDIFGEETAAPETSAREERRQLESDDPTVALPEEKEKKKVIQTFQRKSFMKIGRYEFSPHVGLVTNDPFLHRYLLGAGFTYHPTEVLGIEFSGTWSPDLGTIDYKAVTKEIIANVQVTPDISRIYGYGTANLTFSPIYGKLAVGAERIIAFDIFGLFGTGVVATKDDLVALGATQDDAALASQSQVHPALSYGGGLRVVLSESVAVRLEGRGLSFVEVISSTTLEMKNNFTVVAGASLFFPGMK